MLKLFKLLAVVIFFILSTGCESDSELEKQKYLEGKQISGYEFYFPMGFFGYSSRKLDLSPDGSFLIYRTYDGPILQKLNLETGEKEDVCNSCFSFNPDWSPNGEWIAFNCGTQIAKIKPDGSNLKMLTTEGRNYSPDWSPDGNHILYENGDCGSGGQPPPENSCGVLKMREDGSNNQLIVLYFGNPLWKNSHEFIAGDYLYDTSGVKLDSFNFDIGFSSADLSPNGERIIMGTSDGIYYMNADGTGYKRILPDHWNSDYYDGPIKLLTDAPTWCPDSEHIIYEHFRVTDTKQGRDGTYLEGYISFYKVNVDSALAVSNLKSTN